jgi:hypothetical protein
LFLAAFFSSGCDIVQGFQNASDAVFPEEKTYLDAPGYRIAAGGYRSLGFTAGTDLYLIARSAEATDTSLYAMLYGDPKPCAIRNVRNEQVGDGTVKGPALIAYFEDDQLPSTLHFADATCHTYDLTVPDSWPPYTWLPDGFLVLSGRDLVLVDPVKSTTRTLAGSIQNAYFYAVADTSFVQVGGRLIAFGPDWTPGGSVGDGVVTGASAGGSFFLEDRGGIHRVASSGGSAPTVVDTVIAPDGCALRLPVGLGASESWVTYFAPCAEKKLIVYGTASSHTAELGVVADPGCVALIPDCPVDGDPAVDPFFIFYLADVDATTGLGTLLVRTPDKQERKLGMNAALERLTIVPSASGTEGYALVDVANSLGRYVRWRPDGSTEELATGVVRGMGDLLVNFDGRLGDFALPSTDGLLHVAQGVPPGRFKFRDPKNRWTALFHDLGESSGLLSITRSTLDFSEAVHAPGPPPELDAIASRVVVDARTRFVSSVPGIAYLTNYDVEIDVGRLDYRNLELGFTATVSEGVADYVSTPDGLIYSLPFGDRAGIWAVRAR